MIAVVRESEKERRARKALKYAYDMGYDAKSVEVREDGSVWTCLLEPYEEPVFFQQELTV